MDALVFYYYCGLSESQIPVRVKVFGNVVIRLPSLFYKSVMFDSLAIKLAHLETHIQNIATLHIPCPQQPKEHA
jgi:hypothetical protein